MTPFRERDAASPLIHGARPLTRGELLSLASALAARFPSSDRLINLCESRSAFLITCVAAMLRRQPQLLPGARTPQALAELRARHPAHAITDADVTALRRELASDELASVEEFTVRDDELILTGFTSGSTGIPQSHDKRWAAIQASCRGNGKAIRDALPPGEGATPSLLGTVPVHHMYGVELTMILPLFGGMSVHDDRPLFPADVAAALRQLPMPRVLVSTPLHLRALSESDVDFPEMSLIVSASAPLESALAATIERRLRAPLLEMFGATETCVFASRRTATETEWRLYDDLKLQPDENGTWVSAPWQPADQRLQDVLELRGGSAFVMRGRNSDLIEVAGKRASLADITRRLCAIPGVTDAVVFQPDAVAGSANRVAAAVVGNTVTERQIMEALSAGLDSVFLPRPLLFVEAIPRDTLGKVSRARLRELLTPR